MRKLINVFFVAAGLVFTANIANAQQKVAHLNSQTILMVMPEAKTTQTTLENLEKTKSAEIQKMQTEFQTKYQAALAKQKTLSEANKEAVGKELQTMDTELKDLDTRIKDASVKAQQELAQRQGELTEPILRKLSTAINAVAKEKGLAYVLDVAAQQDGNNVVYFDGGEDITAAVRTKLGIPATATPIQAPAAAAPAAKK